MEGCEATEEDYREPGVAVVCGEKASSGVGRRMIPYLPLTGDLLYCDCDGLSEIFLTPCEIPLKFRTSHCIAPIFPLLTAA